jgi:hypothetical protein
MGKASCPFLLIEVKFYGFSMNQGVTAASTSAADTACQKHEFKVPSWWTAQDFLAVLYVLTVGDVYWLGQGNEQTI